MIDRSNYSLFKEWMNVSIAIPARLNATRFPRKLLADLCGKPVIQRTYEAAVAAGVTADVFVLTDSEEVRNVVTAFGGKAIMTAASCHCGTERIASVLDHITGEWVINIQGDEPLIRQDVIQSVKQRLEQTQGDVVTPIFPIQRLEDLENPARVKVAVASSGHALYFSRSPIPFVRGKDRAQWMEATTFYGHIGLYAYKRTFLEHYFQLKASKLERVESLEQLSFLENGYVIDTVKVDQPTIGIDTPEDLVRAREIFKFLKK